MGLTGRPFSVYYFQQEMKVRYTSITFLASWYALTVTTLIFFISLLAYLSIARVTKPQIPNFTLYSALPQNTVLTGDSIGKADGRAKIIEDFFKGYKSTLADYSNTFIAVADKYNIDYRLLPAISMQESNGGRKVISNSNNPFGYGIYGGRVLRFDTWEDAIERVGRGLKEDYFDKGLNTPDKIMAKYTPPALADGSWSKGVKSFMLELR